METIPPEAGPSKVADRRINGTETTHFVWQAEQQAVPAPPAGLTQPPSDSGYSPNLPLQFQASSVGQFNPSSQSFDYQNVSRSSSSGYTYYGYPPSWANSWPGYSYNSRLMPSQQYTYLQPRPSHNQSLQERDRSTVPRKRKVPSPPPTPPSPPPVNKDWDQVIKEFLVEAGLTQALRGFEADMTVISPDWEQKRVPVALKTLSDNLPKLWSQNGDSTSMLAVAPLDERKISYVNFRPGVVPQAPTSIARDISIFLSRNRARNDTSNRKEFLLSLAEKRRHLEENEVTPTDAELPPTCARTDAKTQDRDIQMKYDIAKNEDGPLRKTLKATAPEIPGSRSSKEGGRGGLEAPTAESHPSLDERLRNLETHLAVRYVPSLPRSLLDRLKFLEDHIIHLEKQFPPWAALHFNQPNRGWPPPPRLTPIIVPSHLTSSTLSPHGESQAAVLMPTEGDEAKSKGKGKLGARNTSSLHRAVMERLEVRKAINDLAGTKTEDCIGRS